MNENILKSALSYITGFIISGTLVMLGIVLIKSTESTLSIFLPLLAIPIMGVYIYENYKSRIGFGMLCFIPIFIVSIIFFIVLNRFIG